MALVREVPPIYTVTVFNVFKDGVRYEDGWSDSRVWGWYPTKEEAEDEIRAESNDLLFESGTYQYALIEEVPAGYMGGLGTRKEWWYTAEHQGEPDDRYVITEMTVPPPFAKNTVMWSMG